MHDDDNDQPQRDYRLDEAIARHYARQQEALPPPVPSTAYLAVPHQRYLTDG